MDEKVNLQNTFRCNTCDKDYSSKSSLCNHNKKFHSKKSEQCSTNVLKNPSEFQKTSETKIQKEYIC